MSSTVTLLCPERAYGKAVDVVRSFNLDFDVVGARNKWERLTLCFAAGTMELTSLVRTAPGDKFSKLVLSMHNFFRTVDTDAEPNKKYVLGRVDSVQMMIGVVADPEFSETDVRLGCILKLAEQLDAVIFNGDAMLTFEVERIMSQSGEHDLLM